MSELMRVCDSCMFFGPQLDHGQEIECIDDGACRKNPPIVMPMGDDGGFAALFPPVNNPVPPDGFCAWAERREQ